MSPPGAVVFFTVRSLRAEWVATAGEEQRCRFGVDPVYGLVSRAGASDHPSGLALDFMVDRATGDKRTSPASAAPASSTR